MASRQPSFADTYTVSAAVLLLLAVIGLVQKIFHALRNQLNFVPGPKYAKWTNLRLKWAVITGQRIHYVHALHESYGPIVRIAPDEVSVADPESVTKIHKINSGFNKSTWYIDVVARYEEENVCSRVLDVLLEAQGLLVAGSDTTAVSLTYLVWAVLSHPEWHQALRTEVNALPEGFTEVNLDPLPVLNAIVEETLRLYGAAPGGLPRIVPTGGATLQDYFMPAGTTVTTQTYTLHRDAELFPRPFKFDPSRWLGSGLSDAAKAMNSPFGFGSRTCIGLHLARMEMKLAATEFFRREKVCLSPMTTPKSMELENFFLIAPASHKCEVMLA